MPRLEQLIAELVREFGDDVALLDKAADPKVDRRKVCRLSISLYSKVLALPTAEAGAILRYMLTQ